VSELAGPVLAIDIGGTKLAVGIVEPNATVRMRAQVPTPVTDDPDAVWSALEAAIRDLPGVEAVVGVGVGCGGPMVVDTGHVSPVNIPAWRDFPLLERISLDWGGLPIRLHNDAICYALAEHWCGAARGVPNVLGMVVSTGVGGGLILDGRLVEGRSGNAGHVGHVVVDPAGPVCGCGGRGCLEAIARGPAVVAWARGQGWTPAGDGSARELAEAARAGNEIAVAAFSRAGNALGVALASVIQLLDLHVVVIGGGLAQARELLFAPMRAGLAQHAQLDFAKDACVVPGTLGRDAGLIGAAALLRRDYSAR